MRTDDRMLVDDLSVVAEATADDDGPQQPHRHHHHHRCKRKRDDLDDADMRVDADIASCDDNPNDDNAEYSDMESNLLASSDSMCAGEVPMTHGNESGTESTTPTTGPPPLGLVWPAVTGAPMQSLGDRNVVMNNGEHMSMKSSSDEQVRNLPYQHLLRKPQKPALIKMINRHASCEEIRSYLVANPGAVHTCDGYYGTALLLALSQPEHHELVALLIEKGANPNQVPNATEATQYDRRFVPPLYAAVLMQSMPDVVLLLNAGADPNLSHMNEYHKGNIISYLLTSTATYVSKTPSSSSLSSAATLFGGDTTGGPNGNNISSSTLSDKIQAIHLARHDPAAFVDWFLTQCEQRHKPVDLMRGPRNASTHLRMSVLHVATYLGMMALVSVLIKHGMSIDTFCEGGYTPLHYAAMRDMSAMVQYLIMNCGANPTVPSKNQYAAQATELAAPHAKRVLLEMRQMNIGTWNV